MWKWTAALIVVVAIASVPLRGRDAAQRASLENAALGFSQWEKDDRGERFRRMTAETGQFYVPADATSMNLPIRLERDSPEGDAVNLEVWLDGELANRVRVQGTSWSGVAMVLPRRGPTLGYRAVRLSIASSNLGAVGRQQPRIEIGVPVFAGPGKR